MEQLLSTKLNIPPIRLKLVPRPHLIKQINESLHRKLTLISAPAGFGKTTLVSEWVEQLQSATAKENQNGSRIAWLTLDEHDNDTIRFLTYFIASLQQTEEGEATLGEAALSMLRSPQPPPTETILTALINDLAAIPDKIIIVLDDYHLISESPVDKALTFLLEHRPPQLHLIINTRVDPQLPLANLRAKDQLNELRAAELRFTSPEAAEFLNHLMGLGLSEESISALESRTEGWIAGLQLAAISLQGKEDVTSFITSFTGSHRLVLDYLIEEVLEQQPENIQDFLLQTAILSRLSGPLCNALTGHEDGQLTLEQLEQANLFIIPLDNERRWYRYHQLFADLLHQRLKNNQIEQLPILHSRASEWYEIQGNADEAFRHALAAGDPERAANIIEPICMTMITDSRLSILQSWLIKLTDEVIEARPWLCVSGAWANLLTGQMSSVKKLLEFAESPLSDTSSETLTDHDQVYGHVTTIRAYLARWQEGDIKRSIELSQEASKYLPADSITARSGLALNLGIANLLLGELTAAASALDDARTAAQKGNNHYAALAAFYNLGQVQVKQGHLHQAANTFQQALKHGIEWGGGQPLPATGFAHVGLSQVLYEWNDLDNALIHLKHGIELSEQANEVSAILDGTFTLIQLKLAQGEMSAASEAFERARALLVKSTRSQVSSQLSAQQVQLWLAQNELAAANIWAKEREILIKGKVQYPRMPEYLALARVLLAQEQTDKASRLLDRLQDDAEKKGRKGDLIKILTLRALIAEIIDDSDQASSTLEKALTLAEPEGFVRTFVDQGTPIARLLYKITSLGISKEYTNRLLASYNLSDKERSVQEKTHIPKDGLIEALSAREIEVLQLIGEGLTNREIASRLFLTLNTIKSHTRNIFEKLNVNNRIQAVSKAKALGILSPD